MCSSQDYKPFIKLKRSPITLLFKSSFNYGILLTVCIHKLGQISNFVDGFETYLDG